MCRYDLRETKTWFLLFFSIPSALFVVSCLMLFLCSHLVGVRPHGAMAIMPSCCPQVSQSQLSSVKKAFVDVKKTM